MDATNLTGKTATNNSCLVYLWIEERSHL